LAVQQKLIDYFIPKISSVTYEDQPVEPPQSVPWYPENLAWVMNVTKHVIRKFPPFAEFQKFLVSENGIGNISRQELVSMIPPLVMDLKPGMKVLDMCAAPGSKSAQLIEMIHEGEEDRVQAAAAKWKETGTSDPSLKTLEGDWSDDGRATGLLIANDSEQKRAQLLVHQTKRLNSANVIVTNHDASNFPSIQIPSKTNRAVYLKFDRILTDVPCTGDGTCRKNFAIWKDWAPGNALGLHSLQFRILVRALQMLKVGGRVVYSTCSLNPIENEAVIAAAIEQSGGMENVQIRDCSQELPGLKRVSGLLSWTVMDRRFRHWKSWAEVQEAFQKNEWENQADKDAASRLAESMFPPLESAAEKMPLERCMRVYPHFQNTGGFFITVLEKVSEIRPRLSAPEKISKYPTADRQGVNGANGTKAENAPRTENGADEGAAAKRPAEEEIGHDTKRTKTDIEAKPTIIREPDVNRNSGNSGKSRGGQSQEEHFKFLQPDAEALQSVYEFYGLAPQFPRDRFMVRNAAGEPAKGIYYTSELVRDILTLNEGKGIKFVHSGVKMFAKQDAQGQNICRWRIQSDGLSLLEPWAGEARIVHLYKRRTLQKMLIELFIKVSGNDWQELDEVGERVRDLEMGCAILVVEKSDDPEGFK
jgi:multisite-specific tRNA:(cytosine-C5)-methyltransferase